MNVGFVGEGKVELVAGGGRMYADVAARIIKSDKDLEEILGTPEDKELISRVLASGHDAIKEFDYFLFAVEGYARPTEVQLVRKRVGASYAIKTGRSDKKGERSFDMVLPHQILEHSVKIPLPTYYVTDIDGKSIEAKDDIVMIDTSAVILLSMIEEWYNTGADAGYKEEELRYMKPQATEFKALIGFTARALTDLASVRCCFKAQTEIRDMVWKMVALAQQVKPELFKNIGPQCKQLLYCPENNLQCTELKGKVPTRDEVKELLKKNK